MSWRGRISVIVLFCNDFQEYISDCDFGVTYVLLIFDTILLVPDPHTPLLHPGVRSPLGHLTALLTGSAVAHSRDGQKEKDGRIQSLNLTRATVAPKARRAPTRRRFEATEDSSLQDLLEMLPSMADFTSRLSSSVPDNWKHFFGVEGGDGGSGVDTGAGNAPTVKVDKVPDEWFEFPSDSLDVAKVRLLVRCASNRRILKTIFYDTHSTCIYQYLLTTGSHFQQLRGR